MNTTNDWSINAGRRKVVASPLGIGMKYTEFHEKVLKKLKELSGSYRTIGADNDIIKRDYNSFTSTTNCAQNIIDARKRRDDTKQYIAYTVIIRKLLKKHGYAPNITGPIHDLVSVCYSNNLSPEFAALVAALYKDKHAKRIRNRVPA